MKTIKSLTVVGLLPAAHHLSCARNDPDRGPCDCGASPIPVVTQADAMAAIRFKPLSKGEIRALTAMVWGAPCDDRWVEDVGMPFITLYERLRSSGERPVDPVSKGRK